MGLHTTRTAGVHPREEIICGRMVSLSLLVLGILLAIHKPNFASFDHVAVRANRLDGRPDLHH
jgi:hypothetical protein